MINKANTMVQYQYRDGSNYKECDYEIVAGRITQEEIEDCLEEGNYFIPEDVGLPELQKRMTSFPSTDDHVWHELEGLTPTDLEPTTKVTAEQLREAFQQHKDKWDIAGAMNRLGLSTEDDLVSTLEEDEEEEP